MSKGNGSLITQEEEKKAREDAQPFLFSKSQLPNIDRSKPAWNSTGEYIFKNDRARYMAAVDMLCEPGISIRQICRTLHISHNTLSSIQEREAPNLDTRKKVILNTVTRGLRLCAERVEELAPEMSARDALVGVGILGEKMQLLGGDATARIEIGGSIDIHSILHKLNEENFKIVGEAHALNTGLEGKNMPQKALEDHGASAAADLEPTNGDSFHVAQFHEECSERINGALVPTSGAEEEEDS